MRTHHSANIEWSSPWSNRFGWNRRQRFVPSTLTAIHHDEFSFDWSIVNSYIASNVKTNWLRLIPFRRIERNWVPLSQCPDWWILMISIAWNRPWIHWHQLASVQWILVNTPFVNVTSTSSWWLRSLRVHRREIFPHVYQVEFSANDSLWLNWSSTLLSFSRESGIPHDPFHWLEIIGDTSLIFNMKSNC